MIIEAFEQLIVYHIIKISSIFYLLHTRKKEKEKKIK